MMKKLIAPFLLTLLAALVLAGCGGSGGPAAQTPPPDCGELLRAMLAADNSFPEMTQVAISVSSLSSDSQEYRDQKKTFSYISDLPFDQVESFAVGYSADGRKADEIAVIRVTETADAEDAAASLERHRADRLKLYQTYGPQEAARVEHGIVEALDGKYAVLIICDDPDTVLDAFKSCLNEAKQGD